MLIAAFGLLGARGALTIVVHSREGHRKEAKKEEAEKPVGGPGGFTLVFKQRYLLLIAMLVLVYNLVNTLGGFMLNTDDRTGGARVAAATAGATEEQVTSHQGFCHRHAVRHGADLRQPAGPRAPGVLRLAHLQVHRRAWRAVHPAGHRRRPATRRSRSCPCC